MAATVTEIGTSAVSANPATSISVTTTAAVNSGEILFFIAGTLSAAATTPTASSPTAGGNAMTQDATATRGVGTTATNIWLFRYESALATSSTVTVTITNGGPGSVGKCIKVAGLVTGVGLDATAGTNNGLSQTPTTGATGTPPSGDEVFSLAALCVNFNATGGTTAGNAYTALADLVQATRSVLLYTAWKDLTAPVSAQNESWTPTTWAANKNWAAVDGLYRVSGGAAPATARPLQTVLSQAVARSGR